MRLSYNPKLGFRISLFLGAAFSIVLLIFRKTIPVPDRYTLCYMYQVFFLLINMDHLIHDGKNSDRYANGPSLFHPLLDRNYLILMAVSLFYSIVLLTFVSDHYVEIVVLTFAAAFFFMIFLGFLSKKGCVYVFYTNLFLLFIAQGSASSGLVRTLVYYNPFGGLITHIFL